jgi:hypothetical protein
VVAALAAAALAVPVAQSHTGGSAAPASVAGGLSGPEPAPMSSTPPAPAPEPEPAVPVPPEAVALTVPEPAEPDPADAARAGADLPILESDDAGVAQTPVEPEPGARPGEDPFEPAPERRAAPREERRPQARAPDLPLTGLEVETAIVLGVGLMAAGIAGLAIGRSAELAAATI